MTATPAPVLSDRTGATDAEFQARIAPIELADPAPESFRPLPGEVEMHRAMNATPEQLERLRATADTLAPFEPEEREAALVETVARAMFATEGSRKSWEEIDDDDRAEYRRLAVAAVSAYRAQGRDLHTPTADVADNLDYYATGGLIDAAGHIRDALR